MSKALIDYLEAVRTERRDVYESRVTARPGNYLAGHYLNLLDEAVQLIGEERLLHMARVAESIRAAQAEMEGQESAALHALDAHLSRRYRAALDAIRRSHSIGGGCLPECATARDEYADCDCGCIDSARNLISYITEVLDGR